MKIKMYTEEQLEFFPVYIKTIDIRFPQPKMVRPDGYEAHQLFLVSGGSGVLNIGGNTFELGEGDMFYIAAGIPHEYYGNDTGFMTSYISFCGDGFKNIKSYFALGDWGMYKSKSRGLFKSSAEHIFEVIDTTHELSTLSAMTFSAVITYFDEVYTKDYSPIENVYNYICENYSKMITLDDILTIYPHSKTKLCRDFKKQYNQTIFDMLLGIRLRHAKHMLDYNPHIKLKNIALSCGFNDVSYFCKMYKRLYGTSPKTFSYR